MSRRILICTNDLHDLAGSELVALELAEHMLSDGWFVDIYTNDFGGAILADLHFHPLWNRVHVVIGERSAHFSDSYDLIWIQHSLLPDTIIDRLATDGVTAPIVWNHMSSFVNIEMPILAAIENEIAAVSTAVSPLVIERIIEFGITPENTALFANPAPDRFADYIRAAPAARLERLLIVSNHPPSEVLQAAAILDAAAVTVDTLGARTTPVRVAPALLADYDAVLTIGKTVQYALSMGTPAYVYDHFGGYGWLGDDNLEAAAFDTFSGRSSQRTLTAEALAAEVQAGYRTARTFAENRRTELAERWRLSTSISSLLADSRVSNASTARLTHAQARQFRSFVSLYGDQRRLCLQLQRQNAVLTDETAIFREPMNLTCAMYWDDGSGISEDRKTTAVYSRDPQATTTLSARFVVPSGTVAARFDPIEGSGCSCRALRVAPDASLSITPVNPTRIDDVTLFATLDPQCDIVGDFSEVTILDVTIEDFRLFAANEELLHQIEAVVRGEQDLRTPQRALLQRLRRRRS